MARVSNPTAEPSDPVNKLIAYLISHKHWSPFEMANACVEINTTRDIARQILRHRSLHFQEFSQRYSVAPEVPVWSEPRLQDTKNRQNSIITDDARLISSWQFWQERVWDVAWGAYQTCLKLGIAKELARKLLPEGLTQTKMYVNGTIRDWLHYLAVRTDGATQYEHRIIAREVYEILKENCPIVFEAAEQASLLKAADAN